MELNIGDKLFGLEKKVYSLSAIPFVFVVHSVTPKFARIQPFDINDYKPFNMKDYKQSSNYTVYRTLVPRDSRFLANWRGQHHPAFSSSFDYLWLWDEVCKRKYLQAVLYLKIKRYIHSLSTQLESLNLDNLQFHLKTFEFLSQLSKNLDSLTLSKSKVLVFSETELAILQVNSLSQILEAFND